MKVKTLKATDGPNPDWDPKDPASKRGVVVPAGTILEGDQAWIHVCTGLAVPADAECWNKIDAWNPELAAKIRRRFPESVIAEAGTDKAPKAKKSQPESQA